jgi:acetyltransferase-like isoleucine patch superfamily enzyme
LKNLVKKLSWGLRKAVVAYQRYVTLEKLRADNPGCTIMSHDIYDARLGENVAILGRTILSRVCMGNFSYVACDSSLRNVDVGNFCSIGPHVQIGLKRHPSRTFVSTYPGFYSNYNEGCPLSFRENKIFDDSVPKTSIGNDVWIGSNVIIPGGIRIGTGAIVAAGSVVVKDVLPYAVVGGNPAKFIRYRFSDEQIEILLASEWWNWSIDKISRNANEFLDVEKFKAIVN